MRTLIPIMLFGICLGILSDLASEWRLDSFGDRVYTRRDALIYTVLAVGMAFFVGLRTRGNDTYAYRQMYESITEAGQTINWLRLSEAPALQYVCNVLHGMRATTQDYFMVMALLTVCIYLWFIRKYTCNIGLSVYYFITMGVYTFTMAAIKQTVAVAFLLLATDRAIERKWGTFLFWVLVAELFHPYAFIYLIVPLLFFQPWSGRTYLLLAGTMTVALALERLTGGIFVMTEALGYTNYGELAFSGEGVNVFRVAVVWVPVVLSFWGRDYLAQKQGRAENLMVNATMVNAMIMFVGLFGTANYFARLANYFLIFQAISLPWILQIFEKRSKRLVAAVSVFAFMCYFYYQMVLSQGAFDQTYSFISVGDFFRQL